LVDRQRPEESRLVTVPRRPHGGLQTALLGERDVAQSEQLLAWARLVAGRREEEQTAAAPAIGTTPPENPVAPASYSGPVPGTPTAADRPETVPRMTNETADPHDPELFNRRFRETP
jgi:hypothetical protein